MAEAQMPKSLDELIRTSELPVFVDFWADWCAPCHRVAPAVRQLAQEFRGRLHVVKVNVDKQPRVAERHGVLSIPTLVLFDGGREVFRLAGARPYEELKEAVASYLSQKK